MGSLTTTNPIENAAWKILIIDDDEEDFLIARDMLKEVQGRKIEVRWVDSFKKGQIELNADHYNAVLVDYDLGGHSGIDLIRSANERVYPSPFILFTGRGNYSVDIEAMQAGATLYLSKGEVTPLILERTIRYAIELKQKEHTLRLSEAQLRQSEAQLRLSEAQLRQSEAQLRQSEARERAKVAEMDAILDAVPAIVWVTRDPRAEEVTGNQAAHDFLRVPSGKNLSKSAPHDAPRNFRVYQDGRELAPEELPLQITAATGQPIRDFEEQVVFDDGDRRDLLGNVTPLLDENGKPNGAVAAFLDVTHRQQVESALREAHQKASWLARFPGENPNPVARVAADGTILYCNAVSANTPGWSCVVGQPLAEPLRQLAERAMALGQEIREDLLLAGRYYSVSVMPIRGDHYANLYGSDITERKAAEAALQKSEERLTEFLESTHDSFFTLDHEWRLQYVNRRFSEIQGIGVAELKGRVFWEVFPRYLGSPVEQAFRKAMEERAPVHFESGGLYSPSWYEVSLYPIKEGISVFAIDRSDEKNTQEKLRNYSQALEKSEEKFAKAFRSSPVAIAISAIADGRFIEVNNSYTKLFGYTREELVGHTSIGLGMFPDPEARNEIVRRLREENGFSEYEIRLLTKTGEPIDVLFSTERIEINGQDSMLSLVVDISKRKQAEAALQEYAERLKRSNEELEQFAFIASHDLQEPLRKIIMFGSNLRQHLSAPAVGSADDTTADYLARMQSAAERMQRMIRGLLELSRINSRGGNFTQVDLNLILAELVSDLEERIQTVNAQVQVDAPLSLEADEMQMRQLFQNLIGNALKFHKPDVVTIIRVSGRVNAKQIPGMVEIRVEDNGIGFEQEYAERIFQPFQRLHGRAEYEGTGLGLAICRKIVERHQGKIVAQSVPGKGSTFILNLPVDQKV